jgi:acetolactate synthase small subunit
MEQEQTEPSTGRALRRELALVKVVAAGKRQDQALDVVGSWSGRLLELSSSSFTAGTVTALRSGVVMLD